MWTTGLSAPGGLVAKDHSRVALHVRFKVDGDADASAGEGGGGGEADGLRPQTRQLLDASAGGKIKLKTPEEATELIENMSASDHAILRDKTNQTTKKSLIELSSHDALLAQNKLLSKQLEILTETLGKLATKLSMGQPTHSSILQVTMSNHKSTESALKNLEVQVGQLAKQIADKSSNNFVANTEQNPKEELMQSYPECKAVMTRSKRFVVAEDEDSVVHKKKIADKKDTDGKKMRRLGELEIMPTQMTLQLADHSITRPYRVIEDVLVRVKHFIFPTDFVVMDISKDIDIPVILGRPFMLTTSCIVEMGKRKLELGNGRRSRGSESKNQNIRSPSEMESRKRARTEDIPSSSTLAPPSITVGQDVQGSQTLVPMLQSSFRGQFIIIHSLQELAHNRPIITMKHFLKQVAWPKAQLPLVRPDEAAPPEPTPV
ncbi:hypothetical protein D0Y65_009680 [Glycine soja]|uniref:Uncharacterized protein n=1 Tax=Glycine soja TaxID=3848 RepID=A0A445L058_GLYSO|nr:hypothetical protein D0Y65_009680 [Glycine soja]